MVTRTLVLAALCLAPFASAERSITVGVLEVTNVIWSTGFHPGFSWINLPVQGELEPRHERGIVPTEPGLYFVGLHFLFSMSSSMIHGVGRDAERIVKHLATRAGALRSA